MNHPDYGETHDVSKDKNINEVNSQDEVNVPDDETIRAQEEKDVGFEKSSTENVPKNSPQILLDSHSSGESHDVSKDKNINDVDSQDVVNAEDTIRAQDDEDVKFDINSKANDPKNIHQLFLDNQEPSCSSATPNDNKRKADSEVEQSDAKRARPSSEIEPEAVKKKAVHITAQVNEDGNSLAKQFRGYEPRLPPEAPPIELDIEASDRARIFCNFVERILMNFDDIDDPVMENIEQMNLEGLNIEDDDLEIEDSDSGVFSRNGDEEV